MAGMRHEARGAAREPGGGTPRRYIEVASRTTVDDQAVTATGIGGPYSFTLTCETIYLVRQ